MAALLLDGGEERAARHLGHDGGDVVDLAGGDECGNLALGQELTLARTLALEQLVLEHVGICLTT